MTFSPVGIGASPRPPAKVDDGAAPTVDAKTGAITIPNSADAAQGKLLAQQAIALLTSHPANQEILRAVFKDFDPKECRPGGAEKQDFAILASYLVAKDFITMKDGKVAGGTLPGPEALKAFAPELQEFAAAKLAPQLTHANAPSAALVPGNAGAATMSAGLAPTDAPPGLTDPGSAEKCATAIAEIQAAIGQIKSQMAAQGADKKALSAELTGLQHDLSTLRSFEARYTLGHAVDPAKTPQDIDAAIAAKIAGNDPLTSKSLQALADDDTGKDNSKKLFNAWGIHPPLTTDKRPYFERLAGKDGAGALRRDLQRYLATGEMSPSLLDCWEKAKIPPNPRSVAETQAWQDNFYLVQLMYKSGLHALELDKHAQNAALKASGDNPVNADRCHAVLAENAARTAGAFDAFRAVAGVADGVHTQWLGEVAHEAQVHKKRAETETDPVKAKRQAELADHQFAVLSSSSRFKANDEKKRAEILRHRGNDGAAKKAEDAQAASARDAIGWDTQQADVQTLVAASPSGATALLPKDVPALQNAKTDLELIPVGLRGAPENQQIAGKVDQGTAKAAGVWLRSTSFDDSLTATDRDAIAKARDAAGKAALDKALSEAKAKGIALPESEQKLIAQRAADDAAAAKIGEKRERIFGTLTQARRAEVEGVLGTRIAANGSALQHFDNAYASADKKLADAHVAAAKKVLGAADDVTHLTTLKADIATDWTTQAEVVIGEQGALARSKTYDVPMAHDSALPPDIQAVNANGADLEVKAAQAALDKAQGVSVGNAMSGVVSPVEKRRNIELAKAALAAAHAKQLLATKMPTPTPAEIAAFRLAEATLNNTSAAIACARADEEKMTGEFWWGDGHASEIDQKSLRKANEQLKATSAQLNAAQAAVDHPLPPTAESVSLAIRMAAYDRALAQGCPPFDAGAIEKRRTDIKTWMGSDTALAPGEKARLASGVFQLEGGLDGYYGEQSHAARAYASYVQAKETALGITKSQWAKDKEATDLGIRIDEGLDGDGPKLAQWAFSTGIARKHSASLAANIATADKMLGADAAARKGASTVQADMDAHRATNAMGLGATLAIYDATIPHAGAARDDALAIAARQHGQQAIILAGTGMVDAAATALDAGLDQAHGIAQPVVRAATLKHVDAAGWRTYEAGFVEAGHGMAQVDPATGQPTKPLALATEPATLLRLAGEADAIHSEALAAGTNIRAPEPADEVAVARYRDFVSADNDASAAKGVTDTRRAITPALFAHFRQSIAARAADARQRLEDGGDTAEKMANAAVHPFVKALTFFQLDGLNHALTEDASDAGHATITGSERSLDGALDAMEQGYTLALRSGPASADAYMAMMFAAVSAPNQALRAQASRDMIAIAAPLARAGSHLTNAHEASTAEMEADRAEAIAKQPAIGRFGWKQAGEVGLFVGTLGIIDTAKDDQQYDGVLRGSHRGSQLLEGLIQLHDDPLFRSYGNLGDPVAMIRAAESFRDLPPEMEMGATTHDYSIDFYTKYTKPIMLAQEAAVLLISVALPMAAPAAVGGEAVEAATIAARLSRTLVSGLELTGNTARAVSVATRFLVGAAHMAGITAAQQLSVEVLTPLIGREKAEAIGAVIGLVQLGKASQIAAGGKMGTQAKDFLKALALPAALSVFRNGIIARMRDPQKAALVESTLNIAEPFIFAGSGELHQWGHAKEASEGALAAVPVEERAALGLLGDTPAAKALAKELRTHEYMAAGTHPSAESLAKNQEAFRAAIEAHNGKHPEAKIPLAVVDTLGARKAVDWAMSESVLGLSKTPTAEQIREVESVARAKLAHIQPALDAEQVTAFLSDRLAPIYAKGLSGLVSGQPMTESERECASHLVDAHAGTVSSVSAAQTFGAIGKAVGLGGDALIAFSEFALRRTMAREIAKETLGTDLSSAQLDRLASALFNGSPKTAAEAATAIRGSDLPEPQREQLALAAATKIASAACSVALADAGSGTAALTQLAQALTAAQIPGPAQQAALTQAAQEYAAKHANGDTPQAQMQAHAAALAEANAALGGELPVDTLRADFASRQLLLAIGRESLGNAPPSEASLSATLHERYGLDATHAESVAKKIHATLAAARAPDPAALLSEAGPPVTAAAPAEVADTAPGLSDTQARAKPDTATLAEHVNTSYALMAEHAFAECEKAGDVVGMRRLHTIADIAARDPELAQSLIMIAIHPLERAVVLAHVDALLQNPDQAYARDALVALSIVQQRSVDNARSRAALAEFIKEPPADNVRCVQRELARLAVGMEGGASHPNIDLVVGLVAARAHADAKLAAKGLSPDAALHVGVDLRFAHDGLPLASDWPTHTAAVSFNGKMVEVPVVADKPGLLNYAYNYVHEAVLGTVKCTAYLPDGTTRVVKVPRERLLAIERNTGGRLVAAEDHTGPQRVRGYVLGKGPEGNAIAWDVSTKTFRLARAKAFAPIAHGSVAAGLVGSEIHLHFESRFANMRESVSHLPPSELAAIEKEMFATYVDPAEYAKLTDTDKEKVEETFLQEKLSGILGHCGSREEQMAIMKVFNVRGSFADVESLRLGLVAYFGTESPSAEAMLRLLSADGLSQAFWTSCALATQQKEEAQLSPLRALQFIAMGSDGIARDQAELSHQLGAKIEARPDVPTPGLGEAQENFTMDPRWETKDPTQTGAYDHQILAFLNTRIGPLQGTSYRSDRVPVGEANGKVVVHAADLDALEARVWHAMTTQPGERVRISVNWIGEAGIPGGAHSMQIMSAYADPTRSGEHFYQVYDPHTGRTEERSAQQMFNPAGGDILVGNGFVSGAYVREDPVVTRARDLFGRQDLAYGDRFSHEFDRAQVLSEDAATHARGVNQLAVLEAVAAIGDANTSHEALATFVRLRDSGRESFVARVLESGASPRAMQEALSGLSTIADIARARPDHAQFLPADFSGRSMTAILEGHLTQPMLRAATEMLVSDLSADQRQAFAEAWQEAHTPQDFAHVLTQAAEWCLDSRAKTGAPAQVPLYGETVSAPAVAGPAITGAAAHDEPPTPASPSDSVFGDHATARAWAEAMSERQNVATTHADPIERMVAAQDAKVLECFTAVKNPAQAKELFDFYGDPKTHTLVATSIGEVEYVGRTDPAKAQLLTERLLGQLRDIQQGLRIFAGDIESAKIYATALRRAALEYNGGDSQAGARQAQALAIIARMDDPTIAKQALRATTVEDKAARQTAQDVIVRLDPTYQGDRAKAAQALAQVLSGPTVSVTTDLFALPGRPGWFQLQAHGSPFSLNLSGSSANARQVADFIRSQPAYLEGTPVRLMACSTGADPTGLAQRVANMLGVPVEAPTTDLDGITGDPIENGKWIVFKPGVAVPEFKAVAEPPRVPSILGNGGIAENEIIQPTVRPPAMVLTDARSVAAQTQLVAQFSPGGLIAARVADADVFATGVTGPSPRVMTALANVVAGPFASVDRAGAANVDHLASVFEGVLAAARKLKGVPLDQAEVNQLALETVLTDATGKGRSPEDLAAMPTAPLLDSAGTSIPNTGAAFWAHAVAADPSFAKKPFMAGTLLHGIPHFSIVEKAVRAAGGTELQAQKAYEAVLGHHMAGFIADGMAKAGIRLDFDAMIRDHQITPETGKRLQQLYDSAVKLARVWRPIIDETIAAGHVLAPAQHAAYAAQAHTLRDVLASLAANDPHVYVQLTCDDAQQFTPVGLPKWLEMFAAGKANNGDLASAVFRGPVTSYLWENRARGTDADFITATHAAAEREGIHFDTATQSYAPAQPGDPEYALYATRIATEPELAKTFADAHDMTREQLAARVGTDPALAQQIVEWMRARPANPGELARLAADRPSDAARVFDDALGDHLPVGAAPPTPSAAAVAVVRDRYETEDVMGAFALSGLTRALSTNATLARRRMAASTLDILATTLDAKRPVDPAIKSLAAEARSVAADLRLERDPAVALERLGALAKNVAIAAKAAMRAELTADSAPQAPVDGTVKVTLRFAEDPRNPHLYQREEGGYTLLSTDASGLAHVRSPSGAIRDVPVSQVAYEHNGFSLAAISPFMLARYEANLSRLGQQDEAGNEAPLRKQWREMLEDARARSPEHVAFLVKLLAAIDPGAEPADPLVERRPLDPRNITAIAHAYAQVKDKSQAELGRGRFPLVTQHGVSTCVIASMEFFEATMSLERALADAAAPERAGQRQIDNVPGTRPRTDELYVLRDNPPPMHATPVKPQLLDAANAALAAPFAATHVFYSPLDVDLSLSMKQMNDATKRDDPAVIISGGEALTVTALERLGNGKTDAFVKDAAGQIRLGTFDTRVENGRLVLELSGVKVTAIGYANGADKPFPREKGTRLEDRPDFRDTIKTLTGKEYERRTLDATLTDADAALRTQDWIAATLARGLPVFAVVGDEGSPGQPDTRHQLQFLNQAIGADGQLQFYVFDPMFGGPSWVDASQFAVGHAAYGKPPAALDTLWVPEDAGKTPVAVAAEADQPILQRAREKLTPDDAARVVVLARRIDEARRSGDPKLTARASVDNSLLDAALAQRAPKMRERLLTMAGNTKLGTGARELLVELARDGKTTAEALRNFAEVNTTMRDGGIDLASLHGGERTFFLEHIASLDAQQSRRLATAMLAMRSHRPELKTWQARMSGALQSFRDASGEKKTAAARDVSFATEVYARLRRGEAVRAKLLLDRWDALKPDEKQALLAVLQNQDAEPGNFLVTSLGAIAKETNAQKQATMRARLLDPDLASALALRAAREKLPLAAQAQAVTDIVRMSDADFAAEQKKAQQTLATARATPKTAVLAAGGSAKLDGRPQPAGDLDDGEGPNRNKSVRRKGGDHGLLRSTQAKREDDAVIHRVTAALHLSPEQARQLHEMVSGRNWSEARIRETAQTEFGSSKHPT